MGPTTEAHQLVTYNLSNPSEGPTIVPTESPAKLHTTAVRPTKAAKAFGKSNKSSKKGDGSDVYAVVDDGDNKPYEIFAKTKTSKTEYKKSKVVV